MDTTTATCVITFDADAYEAAAHGLSAFTDWTMEATGKDASMTGVLRRVEADAAGEREGEYAAVLSTEDEPTSERRFYLYETTFRVL